MHLLRRSILPVTDNLSSDLLLAREILHAARIQRVRHLVHHGAVTVTFAVLGGHATRHDAVLLIIGDNLLRLDSIPLRTDMIRRDHTQLLLHLISLLGDNVWRYQFIGPARVDILKAVLLTIGKFAILGHADRVLCQRGLEKEFAVFDADGGPTVDPLVFKTGLGSGDRVLSRRVADVCAKRSWRSISVVGRPING